jgi:hypothetical protein
VIPGLSLVHSRPTGFVERPPILAPDPITDIRAEADRVAWTYAEPDNFTGYVIKTALVTGVGWASATYLKTTFSLFILNDELPAGTADVLVKPTRYGFEALREARTSPVEEPLDGDIAIGSDYTLNWGAQLGLAVPVEPVADLPTPLSTVTVGDMAALNSALSAAPAGRRIILSNGDYTGTLTVTRSTGTASDPIQIYAATTLQAQITGRVTLSSANVIIARCDVPKGIDLNGSRTRAHRCRCNGVGDSDRNTILINGDDCIADWCETSNFANEGIRNAGYRNRIQRCVLTGKTKSPAGTPSAVISSGGSKADSGKSFKCEIIENLVYANNENNGIELKSSDNVVEGNTILGGGGQSTNINNRHGVRNVYRRNWVEGGGQLQLSDHNSVAVRNKGELGVNGGSVSGDELRSGTSGIVYAEDAVAIDHDGSIEIGGWNGTNPPPKPPLRTILENCTGSVKTISGTYSPRGITSYPRPAAPKKLTTADVGPFGSIS